jgi:transcriptional regulator with XRE-family HTH domain
MDNYIGNRIKELRKERGWSQRRLADEAKLSEGSIRKYESGERNAKYESMQKICNALQTDIRSMLANEGVSIGIDKNDNITVMDLNKIKFIEELAKYCAIKGMIEMFNADRDSMEIMFDNIINEFIKLNKMHNLIGSEKFKKVFRENNISLKEEQ